MRRKRIGYINDARHYYLFAFEPPMDLRDAWRPVDDVAGTNVDTLIYMVERGDGLFYPSKVGRRFGEDLQPFDMTAYYRAWHNMQSLIDRGLDPLTVLIERAHDKDMEFIASLRMTSYLGLDASLKVPDGRGLAHEEVRDHQFAVLRELACDYPTDGVELDFALASGGGPLPLRAEDVAEYTPVLTDWVRDISAMVRSRPGAGGTIGARIYPTEAINTRMGYDVRTWLDEGLVDYVVPMMYIYFNLDADMPIDWVVEAAHENDVSVYGMLQPYVKDEAVGSPERIYPTAAQMRAAAANLWDRGVDGLCTWFMRWPLGDTERAILSEIGDADALVEADKCYTLNERSKEAQELGYEFRLPLVIPQAEADRRYAIPFHIADDVDGAGERIGRIVLRLDVTNLLSADTLTVNLNGQSLASEPLLRGFEWHVAPYQGQSMEFLLTTVRPRKGANVLEIALEKRPPNMVGGITIHNVEIQIEYGAYPSRL